MKKTKRALSLVLLACMLLAAFSSCADNTPPEQTTEPPVTTDEITTYTPPADLSAFVANIESSAFETHTKQTTVKISTEAVNTVKKELFGDNLSWRGNGYGIYNDKTDSFNKYILEAITACGITTLRYPGGIEGDYFIWHETIGNNRKPQIDPFSTSYPTYAKTDGVKYLPTFGWEEFMELCKELGIEAVVQLNAGTGTPKEAADLIKWCIENNYPVSSYAIGNEVNFEAEPVPGVRHTKTPEEYIEFANEVYELIGDLADEIELGIIGLPSAHKLCRDASWDKKVLKALGDKIDFIDCHYGYAPYFTGKSDSDQDIYKSYMAASTYTKRLIELTKDSLNRYTDRGDEINIQITEYGPMGTYYNGTVGAVFLASLLQVMTNEPMISSANHLPMINHPAAANLVGYDPTGGTELYWDNVSTYIFRWYSEQIGRDVLKAEGEIPTFNSKAIGLIPAVDGADLTNTAVYYDKESGKGTVFAINQSVNKNVVFNIELPFDEIRITGVKELYSPDPKLANSGRAPFNTDPKTYKIADKTFNGTITLTSKPISVVKIDFEVIH
ncbi:MAG: hypothetical protein IJF74_00040 [Clostridia bacterium]|nr:hypothetical protein [Clostridia bacterium]